MISEQERRLEILRYVGQRQKSNQKTTKTDVVGHMRDKKLSSGETTFNILKEFIDEGKLIRQEVHSQLHYLTLNEENEFNKIFKSLTDIEKIVKRIIDVGSKNFPPNVLVRIVTTYIFSSKTLINFLLVRVNTKIHSEIDAWILYKKAINLMEKIDNNPYFSFNWTDEVDNNIRRVKMAKSSLTEDFELPPDVNEWFDYIINKSKVFKKQFLTVS